MQNQIYMYIHFAAFMAFCIETQNFERDFVCNLFRFGL